MCHNTTCVADLYWYKSSVYEINWALIFIVFSDLAGTAVVTEKVPWGREHRKLIEDGVKIVD